MHATTEKLNRDRLAHKAEKLTVGKDVELLKLKLDREKFEWQQKVESQEQEIKRKKVEMEAERMKEEMSLKELQLKEEIRLKEEAQKNNFILEKMKIEKECWF
uniref:Rho GTPase-activating protein 24 n=1 Tax=Lygus hesperus TaxID=30085 RepID=A0A0A9Y2G0_LYGHE